jgi:hypothetical protein
MYILKLWQATSRVRWFNDEKTNVSRLTSFSSSGRESFIMCSSRERFSLRGETGTGFWWESPKEGDHMEDQGVDGRMVSKWTLGKLTGGVWSGFTWLRIGTVGGLLWMRWWTFGFWRHGVSRESFRSRMCVLNCHKFYEPPPSAPGFG